ncbi:MAG: hypothetical protein JNK85_11110 [Verrucomicrobiales bacterium]|nr:hypothetical protein [Verrucomicrobiales bacterium]
MNRRIPGSVWCSGWRRPALLGCCLILGCLSLSAGAASVEEVVVVFKTHFDIGYTDMASNVVNRYRTTMMDGALEVVEASRDLPAEQRFVWTLAGWPMAQILKNDGFAGAARLARIQSAMAEGRFVVHGLPFTTHTELLELEDLVRGLEYSRRMAVAAGQALPRDAKMTDVPSHSWVIPTLLRRAGIEFLHLGCNAASRSPAVPRLFWWEGPDGSRVLTMYTAESYGTGLVPPPDWPHRTWLALIHTGDNHGPPTPNEVRSMMAEAALKLPGIRVRIGRLSDFADALRAEQPSLPIIRGDMPDTWIHGPMSDPAGAALARRTRPELSTAESLHTLLGIWGADQNWPKAGVDRAFEGSLLYGEHTWGGGQYWIRRYTDPGGFPYDETWRAWRTQPAVRRLEGSWEEHTDYIRRASAWSRAWLRDGLKRLARSVAVEGRRVVVFNPLPWERDDEVTLDEDFPGDIEGLRPVKGGAGDGIERVDRRGGRATFVARRVPGLGYRTYVPAHAGKGAVRDGIRCDADAGVLENSHFRLVLDSERGAIRSMVERRSGRECVDASSPHGFGAFLYERYSRREVDQFVADYVKISADWATNELGKPLMPSADEVPYRAESVRGFEVEYHRTPIGVEAVMKSRVAVGGDAAAPSGCGVTLRVRLPANLPWVELEMTLTDKAARPWPEAGWWCLPFRIESPEFRLGRLGGVVNPAADLVPGSNHELFALNGGMIVVGARGEGLGLCSLDAPLVSLGRTGCWRYTTRWKERDASVYVNLFNNQWTTNFRFWNEGTWTYRLRLWAIPSQAPIRESLTVPSLEARWPLRGTMTEGGRGTLPPNQEGLSVSERGVLVTSFGRSPADDVGVLGGYSGPAMLPTESAAAPGKVRLRLWDQSGGEGSRRTIRVRLPKGFEDAEIHRTDLRGQPEGRVARRAGRFFQYEMEPWAPATFEFRTPGSESATTP